MKKQMKRVVSVLLAIAMTVSLWPVGVSAKSPVTKLASYTINAQGEFKAYTPFSSNRPVTRDFLNVTDSDAELVQAVSRAEHVASLEEGAAYLRRKAKLHMSEIYFTVDNYTYQEGDEFKLYQELLKHTGEGDEGFYLHMQLKGGYSHAYSYKEKVTFCYQLTYNTTLAQEDAATKTIAALEKKFWNAGEKDKLYYMKSVYRWLITNITYGDEEDTSDLLQHTGYAAVQEKRAVCSGIAALFYRMMLDKEVPCFVLQSSDHAWNAVKVDDMWYELDATWDLLSDPEKPKYFLLSKEEMEAKNHHTVSETGTMEYETLQTLIWSRNRYDSVTGFLLRGVKDAIKYTTKNKGYQDITVTDQDGNLLVEGIDYTLTTSFDGRNYTITGINNSAKTVRGLYYAYLDAPKITKIVRQTKKVKGVTYARIKVYWKKVPGAKCYQVCTTSATAWKTSMPLYFGTCYYSFPHTVTGTSCTSKWEKVYKKNPGRTVLMPDNYLNAIGVCVVAWDNTNLPAAGEIGTSYSQAILPKKKSSISNPTCYRWAHVGLKYIKL